MQHEAVIYRVVISNTQLEKQIWTLINQRTIKAETIAVVAECMDDTDSSTGIADCLLDEV